MTYKIEAISQHMADEMKMVFDNEQKLEVEINPGLLVEGKAALAIITGLEGGDVVVRSRAQGQEL